MWKHVLDNVLVHYLPIAAAWVVAVWFSNSRQHRKKKMAIGGAILLLLVVVGVSLFTAPPDPPLEAEWAFYAVRENQDSSPNLWSLIGNEKSPLLGIEGVTTITGIPEVQSGDIAQMRIKLNRKGYVQVVQLDSTLQAVRQLFPAPDTVHTQEIPDGMWFEIPRGAEGWRFDTVPGYEMFVVLVSTKPGDDIRPELTKLREHMPTGYCSSGDFLMSLENALRQVAFCGETSYGTYPHGLAGVEPSTVQTRVFRSVDGESAVLVRRVRHAS